MTTSDAIQTTQMHVDPEVIDLGIGQPQLSLLPLARIRQAAEIRFAQNDPSFLQYGAEQGDGYLRLALSTYLSSEYDFPVQPDQLFITNGASLGLDLTCTLYTKPGDTIFVEEPSYFLALHIFRDHQLRVVPIPVDENGLDVDVLEKALRQNHPALVYTIPTFQNPSGYTMPEERRARLAHLSREYNFLIVADEVYHLLHFGQVPPKAFAGFTDEGNIVSLGSFSKILAPGLRLGWIQTDVKRAAAFGSCGLVDSGGGLNPFTAAIVRTLVENGGLKRNILELQAVYRSRVEVMDAALRQHLPDAYFHSPEGGYFFWVRLPTGRDAETLVAHAEAHKVSYRAGVRFSSQGGLRDWLRLCFAYYPAEQLAEGVARLGRVLETYG